MLFEHHDVQRVSEVIHLLNGHGFPSQELMAFPRTIDLVGCEPFKQRRGIRYALQPAGGASACFIFFSFLRAGAGANVIDLSW